MQHRKFSVPLSSAALLVAAGLTSPLYAEPQVPPPSPASEPAALEAKVKAMEEPVKALDADVKKLKALKIAGYVQARYEMNQSSKDGLAPDGKSAANRDQFYIRRGRLQATWSGVKHTQVMLQIDATGKGVSLVDAEVSLLSPWKPVEAKLTLGQTKLPFSSELLMPDTEVELPERSIAITRLFPGSRDRGLRLMGKFKFIQFGAGVFNGNSIDDTSTVFSYQTDKNGDGTIGEDEQSIKPSASLNFGNSDRDAKKDVAGRIGVDFGFLSAAFNGYYGQYGKLSTLVATTDPETGVTTYSGGDALTYIDKTRFGGELVFGHPLIKSLGKTGLRAEYIQGHGLIEKATEADTDLRAWYLLLSQQLGEHMQLAFRLEHFDPDLATEADQSLVIEPGVNLFLLPAIKLSASYQLLRDEKGENGADKENNQFTIQLQGRF